MSLQKFLLYVNPTVEYLNTVLAGPIETLQNYLSLRLDSLPSFLQTPLSFALLSMFIVYSVISHAGNFIWNLVGVVYPLMYSALTYGDISTNLENSLRMNKYWMLFGGIVVSEIFLGVLLHMIPGYNYLKLATVYALVRNDFAMTDTVFGMTQTYYRHFNIGTFIQKVYVQLNLGHILSNDLNTVDSDSSLTEQTHDKSE
jgi:hypothetical protein